MQQSVASFAQAEMVQKQLILALALHGAASGCHETKPWPQHRPIPPVQAEAQFNPFEGSWLRAPPFVCQESFSCEQAAVCIDEHHLVAVDDERCDCDGEACPGRCEPRLPASECPTGTVCRNVPSSGLRGLPASIAACVDESQLSTDAGVVAPPFAGVCGNAERDNVEECDDGNQLSGDGCSQFCTLEAGFQCAGWGSACFPDAGDAACSPSACRLGASCVDTIEVPHPIAATIGTSCACPAAALPACPPLVAFQLPLTSEATRCAGRGISGDGATVVGVCDDLDRAAPGPVVGEQAVRWTIERGAEVVPAERDAAALAVSADGSVVVGRDALGPFIWTQDEMLHPGADLGAAESVSADGRVVVGGSTRAWVWTPEAGVRDLPPSSEGRQTGATRVSADGGRIIGFEVTGEGTRLPLLWNVDGELEELPPSAPPNGRVALIALDASGSVLIGNYGPTGGAPRGIWSWTGTVGATIGASGDSAVALSADGRLLVGNRLGTSLYRLDRSAAFDYLLPRTPFVHVIDFSANAVSADAGTLSGAASLVAPRDSRLRAALTWLP